MQRAAEAGIITHGIWYRKMRPANNGKRKTTNDSSNRTTKSGVIRTFGEKENNEYLGILEADTIKQAEVYEKDLKRVSQKNEKTT